MAPPMAGSCAVCFPQSEKLPMLKAVLQSAQAPFRQELAGQIDLLEDLGDLIQRAIVEDPPFSIRGRGHDPDRLP